MTAANPQGTKRKLGRPRATIPLKAVSTNFAPPLLDAIERARQRREDANPGFAVTTSDTIRALLMKAIAVEESELKGMAENAASNQLTLESNTKSS